MPPPNPPRKYQEFSRGVWGGQGKVIHRAILFISCYLLQLARTSVYTSAKHIAAHMHTQKIINGKISIMI